MTPIKGGHLYSILSHLILANCLLCLLLLYVYSVNPISFHLREEYGWNKQIKCFVDHLHRAGEAGGASKNTSFCQWSPPPSTLREKSTVGKSLWFWCTSRSFSTIYQILFAQLNISVWSNQNYQNSLVGLHRMRFPSIIRIADEERERVTYYGDDDDDDDGREGYIRIWERSFREH